MMNGIHCEDKYDYESLWPRHFKSTLPSCQCEPFILSCFLGSEYISGNSSEKLTKLAFRPPHNGLVLLHPPPQDLITLREIAHAGRQNKQRHLTK